ncbi:MAG: hypothetical protein JTT11_00580 [Candidatus Brockarchaeota archaeon]|nr:hypothetical protein [Candidatus Brockarchaeota archaeon]
MAGKKRAGWKKFEACGSCGYKGGFHLALQRRAGGQVSVKLKCPSCAKAFDLGWKIRL